MEKLEVIKVAHFIDHYLEILERTVNDELLGKKIAATQTEWREIAFAITACLCGVETSSLLGMSRKDFRKKKRRLIDSIEIEIEEGTATSPSLMSLTAPVHEKEQ